MNECNKKEADSEIQRTDRGEMEVERKETEQGIEKYTLLHINELQGYIVQRREQKPVFHKNFKMQYN